MLTDPWIEFEDFSFTYRGKERPAVGPVSLRIGKGITLLAGRSGCGKTTLLRSINGLIPHMYPGTSKGRVFVNGMEAEVSSVSELATEVGILFQNPENQIFMFSVERDIAFGLENLGIPRKEMEERVQWALELLEIKDLAKKAPHELSDGQKQRVALAGVIVMKPRVILLDEPTSLLDPLTAIELLKELKTMQEELGLCVLAVEHRLDHLVSIATRLLVMEEGRITLDGHPREVLREEVVFNTLGPLDIPRLHMALEESGAKLGELSLTPRGLLQRIENLP